MAVSQNPILRRTPDHTEEAYRGFAMQQMGILKDYMALAGLSSYSRVVRLDNGVVITCKKSFNREDVFVSVPSCSGEVIEAKELETFIAIFFNAPYVDESVKAEGCIKPEIVSGKFDSFVNDNIDSTSVNGLQSFMQYWYDDESTYIGSSCKNRYEFKDSLNPTTLIAYLNSEYSLSFTVIDLKENLVTKISTSSLPDSGYLEGYVRSVCKYRHATKTIYILATLRVDASTEALSTQIYFNDDGSWKAITGDVSQISPDTKLFFNSDGNIGYGQQDYGLLTASFSYSDSGQSSMSMSVSVAEPEVYSRISTTIPASPYGQMTNGTYFNTHSGHLEFVDVIGNTVLKAYLEDETNEYWKSDWYGNVGRFSEGPQRYGLVSDGVRMSLVGTDVKRYMPGAFGTYPGDISLDGSYTQTTELTYYQNLFIDLRTTEKVFGIVTAAQKRVYHLEIGPSYYFDGVDYHYDIPIPHVILDQHIDDLQYSEFTNAGTVLEHVDILSFDDWLYKDYGVTDINNTTMYMLKNAVGRNGEEVLRLVIPGATVDESRVFISWGNALEGQDIFNYYSKQDLQTSSPLDGLHTKSINSKLIYNAELTASQ